MFSFKKFLLTEGGNAVAQFGVSRASKSDIENALLFVASHSDIPLDYLKANLLGGTETTLLGLKKDSGDVDIGIQKSEFDTEKIISDLMKATGNEGEFSKGLGVASFAIPVGKGKKIQVDLMLVNDAKWAKFHYSSAEGKTSQYKGAIRTILLMMSAKYNVEAGKDLVLFDEKGTPIVRVGLSWKPAQGLIRVFKLAKRGKTGKYTKTMDDASIEEIKKVVSEINPKAKFAEVAEQYADPDKAVARIFGKGIGAKDVESTEQVIGLIRKKFDDDTQEKIFKEAAKNLKHISKLPPEISQYVS